MNETIYIGIVLLRQTQLFSFRAILSALIFELGFAPDLDFNQPPTKGMHRGISVSGHNFESGMVGCGLGLLDDALKLVYDHHPPPLPSDKRLEDGETSTKILLIL